MIRTLQTFAVTTLLVFALLAGTAQSRPCAVNGKGPGPYKTAQLTAEEQKTVQEINAKYQASMVEKKAKLHAKRAELKATMAAEKFDAAKARELSKETAALHSELMELQMVQCIEMREKGLASCATCRPGAQHRGCPLGQGKQPVGPAPCPKAP
ncbi:hypothetical protein A7E78_03570 [Syntrophotalea acetylenivorans]|uniref:Periplasmic heavy metal sensor n=1 Tax=Syntrophotalea acetylenivorans TaxID=1842532 RepID=A0A1L3GM79_9BACT|nr:periplasmic heavy metal sensor [Syntrophotalea acetylenivorans]APG26991.1 hypothetical protein A7E78_03570 [Syntrophotalea acetylenivorans]